MGPNINLGPILRLESELGGLVGLRQREIGETSGRARTGADFETCGLSNADDLVQAAHGDSARSEYSVIVW